MRVHQTDRARALVVVAWLLFILSFFLPATNVASNPGEGNSPLSGWDAMCSPILCVGAMPWVLIADPTLLLFFLFPLFNLAMLMSPMLALGEPEGAPLAAIVLIPAGILPLMLPDRLTRDVFIGFHFWVLSFFLMSAGCLWLGRCSRWTPPRPILRRDA